MKLAIRSLALFLLICLGLSHATDMMLGRPEPYFFKVLGDSFKIIPETGKLEDYLKHKNVYPKPPEPYSRVLLLVENYFVPGTILYTDEANNKVFFAKLGAKDSSEALTEIEVFPGRLKLNFGGKIEEEKSNDIKFWTDGKDKYASVALHRDFSEAYKIGLQSENVLKFVVKDAEQVHPTTYYKVVALNKPFGVKP